MGFVYNNCHFSIGFCLQNPILEKTFFNDLRLDSMLWKKKKKMDSMYNFFLKISEKTNEYWDNKSSCQGCLVIS